MFQLVVQGRDLERVIFHTRVATDRPARRSFHVPFNPLAVEHTQARDSVESSLHAAGSRGLVRSVGGVNLNPAQ